jgi:N-acyl-D-amino-acid deacylase
MAPLIKGCTTKKDLDLIVKGGEVFDGSGKPAVQADIGIAGDQIKEIGKLPAERAKTVIEAQGLTVCPGFIDVHNHSYSTLLVEPKAQSMIRQGVTTLVSGNCGWSPFPFAAEKVEEIRHNLKERYQLDLNWTDIHGFFSRLQEKGMALNYATFVGQGSIRGAVVGLDNRPPTAAEIEKMKQMVTDNMKSGAIGISTGLTYAPGIFSKTEELTELCRAAARLGGVYATHMRDESDHLLKAIDESITIAKQAGLPLQISHFKIASPRNWHKIDDAVKKIESARADGLDITCDRYPYIASSTGLASYFPSWARQGNDADFLARLKDPRHEARLRAHLAKREKRLGSWDKVIIADVVTDANERFEGQNILQAAKLTNKDPYQFIRDLLIEENKRVGMVSFTMKEENLKRIISHPQVGIGSDGHALAPYGPLSDGKPHPRSYGTFPRALGKYVRDEKVLGFSEMLEKFTSKPAKKFGFSRRGLLKPGYFADLVILDRKRIADQATFKDPHQYPVGFEHVLVNGQPVIKNSEHTGRLPGKILKHQKRSHKGV